MALADRLREVVAAEDDDFFLDDTLVYYINKGQQKVVSYMINLEDEKDVSLRALDDLKSVTEVTLSTGTARGSAFEVEESFPADLKQYNSLIYNDATILKELGQKKLHLLEVGNVVPSETESYFYVTNDGTNKVFRFYLYENPDGSTDAVEIFYTKEPTDIVLADDSFAEIPTQLENAVIYAAATMMAGQELSQGFELYNNIYQEELQANVY